MSRDDIEDDLEFVLFFFDQIVETLERRARKSAATVKASRGTILRTYLLHRDIDVTAARCGVSRTTARFVLARACYCGERLHDRLLRSQPGCELRE